MDFDKVSVDSETGKLNIEFSALPISSIKVILTTYDMDKIKELDLENNYFK